MWLFGQCRTVLLHHNNPKANGIHVDSSKLKHDDNIHFFVTTESENKNYRI